MLFLNTGAHGVELTGGAELLVLVRDKIRVLLHENLPRRPEIELRGLIPEKFAMDPRPDQAAIGVDVDFGHAELGGRQIFFFVDAARGRIELAASSIDSLTSSIGTLELPCMTIGVPGNPFADPFDDIEMQPLLTFELVSAVTCADRGRQRITSGSFDEFDGFIRIR